MGYPGIIWDKTWVKSTENVVFSRHKMWYAGGEHKFYDNAVISGLGGVVGMVSGVPFSRVVEFAGQAAALVGELNELFDRKSPIGEVELTRLTKIFYLVKMIGRGNVHNDPDIDLTEIKISYSRVLDKSDNRLIGISPIGHYKATYFGVSLDYLCFPNLALVYSVVDVECGIRLLSAAAE